MEQGERNRKEDKEMNLRKAADKLNKAAPKGERLIYANPLEEAMLKSMGGQGKPSSGGGPSYKKGDIAIPPAPPQQSYGEGMREGLQAQIDLGPQLFQAEASQAFGRPAYAQLESDIIKQSLLGPQGRGGGLIDLMGVRGAGRDPSGQFGGLAQFGADVAEYGASRQRAADIRDVAQYGQQATEALRQADPMSTMMMDQMRQTAQQEMAGAGQGRFGGLLGMMGSQAREGLAAGDDLSARERRTAIQDARMASEARGRGLDPISAVEELESLERMRMARRGERRGFAGQVMQSEDARRAAAQQYGQQALAAQRAMAADPFMAILGRPSGMGQQIAQAGRGAGRGALGAGPGVVFNPEAGLSYMLGQQANAANLQAAGMGAKAQRSAGLFGGLGAAIGGIF